jgi:hypothetical protein
MRHGAYRAACRSVEMEIASHAQSAAARARGLYGARQTAQRAGVLGRR